jgi:Uma2 family endonuclease
MALATASSSFAKRLAARSNDPSRDRIQRLPDVSWEDYQRLLGMRGEGSVPRIAFLEGAVELMSPSQPHESLASRIGRLIEVWCLEKGVEFRAVGSWTLKNKRRRAGAEADECYIFGTEPKPRRPHLAIEVVWTSGGLKKLEIWRRLDVPEDWFWRRGVLSVHVLRDRQYQESPASEVLTGIDLHVLTGCLDELTDSQCIRAYRTRLRTRR